MPEMDSNSPATTLLRRRRGPGRWLQTVLKLAIVAAAVYLACHFVAEIGWSELLDRARSANSVLLGAAVLCLVARFVVAYWRWAQALNLLDLPLSHLYGISSLLAAVMVNHLTATVRLLGGVMRGRYISSRYQMSFSRAFGTVLIDQVSHQLVLGVVTWLALAFFTWTIGFRGLAAVVLGSLLALLGGVALWLSRRKDTRERPLAGLVRRWVERQARRLGPLYSGSQRVAALFRQAFSDRSLQIHMALFGVALLTFNALAQWLIFKSLDSHVGLLTALVAVALGAAAGVVTGTPGGIATTEAAMVAVYVALGVNEVDAAAGTLLYRSLHYLQVLALGLPSLIYCELWGRKGTSSGSQSAAEGPQDSESHFAESRPDPTA